MVNKNLIMPIIIFLSLGLIFFISHFIKNYYKEKNEKIIEVYNDKITEAQKNIIKYRKMNKSKIDKINASKKYSNKEKELIIEELTKENEILTDIYENSLNKKPSDSDLRELFYKSDEYLDKLKNLNNVN